MLYGTTSDAHKVKRTKTELSDAVLPAGQDVHERLEFSLKNEKRPGNPKNPFVF